jgi:Fe-S-cluster containining protein
MDDELNADTRLLNGIARAWNRAARMAGAHLRCRVGCSECCYGPFPLSALDARRLRRGFECLQSEDPERAGAMRRRAEQAWNALVEDFPGDRQRGVFNGDENVEERFCARFSVLPCPVLDPESKRCELYPARPLSCRTFGPPVRIGAVDLPPCRLCFNSAEAIEVERCRVEIDQEGIEERILHMLDDRGVPRGETIVACALIKDTWLKGEAREIDSDDDERRD